MSNQNENQTVIISNNKIEKQILQLQIKYNLNYFKEHILQDYLKKEVFDEFSQNLEHCQLIKLLEIINTKINDHSVLKMLKKIQQFHFGDQIDSILIKLILEYKKTNNLELQMSEQQSFKLKAIGQIIKDNQNLNAKHEEQEKGDLTNKQKKQEESQVLKQDEFDNLIQLGINYDPYSSLYKQITQFINKYKNQNLNEFFKKNTNSIFCEAGLLMLDLEYTNLIQSKQSKLNQEILIETEKQDTSKLNWNDNQIKRLMYDDFKQLLTQVYKFQPFQSSVNEYAKFYLNELHISFNLSNNLYYFLNKKQYNLSQNKKDLLELLNEIKQSGYQFEGVVKEILDQYRGNHLSENGFKRHLYEMVKIPEDAFLDIEAEMNQRYSSEVTNNGGLFVVEDKPLSQTSSDQLKELLFKVRSQSLQKVKAIDEDKILNQMKEECYKSISIVDQTEFIFLLKALKRNQVEEAKKYYKPAYKDTLQQFQNCENEKIKQALTVILSQNDFIS